ncbi:hypothetical protein [Breoghania sp.]|uniref:hypothetical protein n=1 Tax=Breoghania sp. TaxID=2065378 RepID=UPI002AA7162B|nr:hypothetical protein [Breoghania sp.]
MVKRLVAKVREYERDGQTKGEYVRIGVILSNDNGEYALIDPTVNLAGVLFKQNRLAHAKGNQPRDAVMASIWAENNQQTGGGSGGGYGDDSVPY